MRKPRPDLHQTMHKAKYLEYNFAQIMQQPQIEDDLINITFRERLKRKEFGATIRGAAFAEAARPLLVSETDDSPETHRQLYRSVADVGSRQLDLATVQGVSFSRNDYLAVHLDSSEQDYDTSRTLLSFFKKTQFLYSAPYFRNLRVNDEVPEFVVLGASNCGKSSFINALLGNRQVAYSSKKPGATECLNSYAIGVVTKDIAPPLPGEPTAGVVSIHPKRKRRRRRKKKKKPEIVRNDLMMASASPSCRGLVLVDTPGYGFRSRFAFGDAVMQYLGRRRLLRGAILLLSITKSNPVSEQDEWILRALALNATPTLVVVTKIDKKGIEWPDRCAVFGQRLLNDLDQINKQSALGKWRTSTDQDNHSIWFTASRLKALVSKNCGIAHIRKLLVEMAGLHVHNDSVCNKQETIEYNGPVVSHQELQEAATAAAAPPIPQTSPGRQPKDRSRRKPLPRQDYLRIMQKAGPWPTIGPDDPAPITPTATGYAPPPEPAGPEPSPEMALKKEQEDVKAARRVYAWAKKPRRLRR
ncbi:hypothetical protein CDD82_1991 [Ophiocordyceps australis]|uniref:EngB-type G domain-containing protein n=1 Tax=Ophiocordyceps australis TaxID=1399860 RepID=A0A2C5XWK0_9HYPO|nr:hypothetical protein CDD82_1991 [Ophiocordyceps australis]